MSGARKLVGTVPLLIGLATQAVTTYLVLVIAGRALGSDRFGGLSALYVLITSVATGLFLPLEQEVARRRGDERGRSAWDSTLLRRATALGFYMSSGGIGLALLAHSYTLRLVGNHQQLLVAFCVAIPGYACCFVTRGELAGRGELVRYSVQLSVEGIVRIVGAVVLVAVHWDSVSAYGWLFAAAPWTALAVSMIGWSIRPPAATPWTGEPLLKRVSLLVMSCLSSQLLINAGPLIVALLATSTDRAAVGVFLAALVLVRVPVFLFTAVQPSFLPAMAEHAAADRRADFVHLVRRVLLACGALTVISAVVVVSAGPLAIRLLFGFHDGLSRLILLEMTSSVGLFLIEAILAQALLGRNQHSAGTVGWICGLIGMAAGTAIGKSAVERASDGFLLGAIVATAVLSAYLMRSLKQWAQLTTASAVPAGY